jgi:RND family efflux transporter MFP subunit
MKKLFSLLLIPLSILLGAGSLVAFLIKTKPEPQQSTPPKIIPHVEVMTIKTDTHTPWIETFGTVRSYYETQLASLVAGEIIYISPRFHAGESVKKDDVLVKLNPADYLANLAKQKSAVAAAQQKLEEEKVRAKLAKNDWISSGRKLEDAAPYTLRIPHVESATQALASAEAALTKANLDLERTNIKSPYDAIIKNRSANPGSIVGIGSALGKLIAREKAEVRLSLTPSEVKQLKLPLAFRHPEGSDKDGSPHRETLAVQLNSPAYPNIHWDALVTRTEASIDPRNQVVFVVAEIDNPFDTPNTAPLPIGTFVKARMQGKPQPNTVSLPESAIVDDLYIWVIDQNSKLRKQNISRIYSAKGNVLAQLPEEQSGTEFSISVRPLPSFSEGLTVQATPTTKH